MDNINRNNPAITENRTDSLRSIEEVEAEINRLAELLGVKSRSWNKLPVFGDQHRYNRTFIRIDAEGYHFWVNERHREYEFAVTRDFDKILFWSFELAIAIAATTYAREHKIANQDLRRISHPRGIELFARISPTCAERWRDKIAASLKHYPYDDSTDQRFALHKDNIAQGIPADDSWRIALERYPAPTPQQSLRPF